MPAYSAEVLADTPLLYWRFLTAAGTADSSGNSQTGTMSGPVRSLARRLTVEADSASALFPGTAGADGEIRRTGVTGISTTAGTKTTVTCWATFPTGGPSQVLFGFTDGPAANLSLWWTGNQLVFNTGNSDGFGLSINRSIDLELGRGDPVHIAVVFNSDDYTQNKIYINGISQTVTQEFATPGNDFVGTTFILGSNGNNTYTWGGHLGEVALFNGELSAARILAQYNAGVPSPSAYDSLILAQSPLAYWKFDETSGAPQDSSGNARHLTVGGGNVIYGLPGPFGGRSLGNSGDWFLDATIPAANTTAGTDVTAVFWMWWDALAGGGTGTSGDPIAWVNGSTNYALFFRGENDRFGFNTWNSDAWGLVTPSEFNAMRLWRMVVASFHNGNRANCQLWVDGEKKGGLTDTQVEGGTNTVTGNFRVGAGEGGQPWWGRLARPALFNGTLSDSVIRQLYAAARSAQQEGYVGQAMRVV